MSLLKFKFSLYELTYCSYSHAPIDGCLVNIPPIREIVQTINVVNLLNPCEKFVITYIYYNQNNIISGTGYLTPENPNNVKGVWSLSSPAATILSKFLFDGIPYKNNLINLTEKFYVFDNMSGKIVVVSLVVDNGNVTIDASYV